MVAKTLRISFNDLHPEVQRAVRVFLAGSKGLGTPVIGGLVGMPGFTDMTGLPIVIGGGMVVGAGGEKYAEEVAKRLTQRVVARIREFGLVKPELEVGYKRKGIDSKSVEKTFPFMRIEANGDIVLAKKPNK